jgi:uncharacterized membrane protein
MSKKEPTVREKFHASIICGIALLFCSIGLLGYMIYTANVPFTAYELLVVAVFLFFGIIFSVSAKEHYAVLRQKKEVDKNESPKSQTIQRPDPIPRDGHRDLNFSNRSYLSFPCMF